MEFRLKADSFQKCGINVLNFVSSCRIAGEAAHREDFPRSEYRSPDGVPGRGHCSERLDAVDVQVRKNVGENLKYRNRYINIGRRISEISNVSL